MASTCRSLNDSSNGEPRWPEVPKVTRWAGSAGSGMPVKYAVTSLPTSTSSDAGTDSPARGLIRLAMVASSGTRALIAQTAVAADQRIGRAVMAQLGLADALELGNGPQRQRFAELDAP